MVALRRSTGFTLIELVAVIVILGAVSVGVFGFIRSGVQVFVDVTERDQILSDSRFVVERINRELRAALPNSARTLRGVSGGQLVQCLEFMPIIWSSVYFDIPTGADSASSIETVPWDSTNFTYVYQASHAVVVYPTDVEDGYTNALDNGSGVFEGKRHALASQPVHAGNDTPITLSFSNTVRYDQDSPSERMYIVSTPVSYCAQADGDIVRYSGYDVSAAQSLTFATGGIVQSGVLMAQNQINDLTDVSVLPFEVEPASLVRNSTILALLQFSRGEEVVVFNNEVHLPNAP